MFVALCAFMLPPLDSQAGSREMPFTGDVKQLIDMRDEAETVLKQNLGSFYWPNYVADKAAGKETAWDYVKDDPKLPRALLIGDSFSRGYSVSTRHALAG